MFRTVILKKNRKRIIRRKKVYYIQEKVGLFWNNLSDSPLNKFPLYVCDIAFRNKEDALSFFDSHSKTGIEHDFEKTS